jgi:uncharacterized membrane protein
MRPPRGVHGEPTNRIGVSPGRLHGLTDGVFAIAVTLLVLDLPRPVSAENLASALWHQWPAYVAYVVSFATVGILWIEHVGMLSAVRSVNRRFLELTLMFLLFVTVVPWPTSLAAEHVNEGGPAARTAALLYAGLMLMLGLTFTLSWSFLMRNPALVAEPARAAFPSAARRALLGSFAYVAAIVIAFVSPLASFALDALVVAYFAASRTDVPGLIARAAATGEG